MTVVYHLHNSNTDNGCYLQCAMATHFWAFVLFNYACEKDRKPVTNNKF